MRRSSNSSFVGVLITIFIVFLFLFMGFMIVRGFTDESGTIAVLQGAGYTDIKITGARPFMKGEHDLYSTGFEAIGPTGKKVTGAVTAGLLKGSTIRFD